MSTDKSREGLIGFLDYLGTKGLMPQATVASRKASVGKVLSILHEDEAADVTTLNVDDVMTRFHHLEGKNYSPGSLNTYRSRLRASIDDFVTYLANPLGFRPNSQVRERRQPQGMPKGRGGAGENRGKPSEGPPKPASVPSVNIFPIPIRPDVIVFVQGIPYDLTETEAAKIANVIRAMAASS